MSRLRAEAVVAGYPGRRILHGVDLEIPDGLMSVIVGPNACGKSTLLRSLARMLPVEQGRVLLDDSEISSLPSKEVARRLGLLPQGPVAPAGMSVSELVSRGRYPHQGLFRQWSEADEVAVREALEAADVDSLTDRSLDQLSGGQRQRVWLAMVLAQQTPLLLLDEPTTYLDVAHQIEVLELARRLRLEGRTVVAVLHELHLAFRYAEHLIVMHEGQVVATGDPREVVTAELIEEVYDLPCQIITDPVTGTPIVIPLVGAR